jgi:hypothetical protein
MAANMAPDFIEAITSPRQWATVSATLVLVRLAVGLHYAILEQPNQRMTQRHRARRPLILALITWSASFTNLEMQKIWSR